jgi:hypothetical protein
MMHHKLTVCIGCMLPKGAGNMIQENFMIPDQFWFVDLNFIKGLKSYSYLLINFGKNSVKPIVIYNTCGYKTF